MKPGFYWVKPFDGSWQVGRASYCTGWEGEQVLIWFLCGCDGEFDSEDMEHIGAPIKGQPDEPSLALDEVL